MNTFANKNLDEIKFSHFNPNELKHSCPSLNEKENYHFGDLGNIIADSEGKAFLSLIRKIDIKSLNGRVVVISNSPDNCQEDYDADNLADIISLGSLSTVKSNFSEKNYKSQEYSISEINSMKKLEYKNKNQRELKEKKIKGNFLNLF